MYQDLKLYFSEKKWIIIFLLAIISFILGYIGFYYSSPLDSKGTHPSPSDIAYLSIQLFVFQSGAEVYQPHMALDIARYLAPMTTLITLILIVTIVFYRNFLYTYIRLLVHDHTIICGLGYVGPVIAKSLAERSFHGESSRRHKIVIIEKNPLNPEIDECKRWGAIVIEGDATKEYFLKRAHIRKARCIYCVTGEDDLNAQIALQAKEMHGTTGEKRLTCYIHIVDPRLTNFLKIGQMAIDDGSNIEFEFFNIYQNAGRCIINELPFYHVDTTPPPHRIHLLILGLGRMGESVLVQAVKKWKEQGFLEKTGNKIKISFIDRHAERKYSLLQVRYPSLYHYCDVIPCQMELESAEFLSGSYLLDDNKHCDTTHVFICFDNASVGFFAAMTLSDQLNEIRDRCPHVLGNYSIPLFIRTTYEKGVTDLFGNLSKKGSEYTNIRIFPLISCPCCIDFLLGGMREQLARAIHENYLKNRLAEGKQIGSKPAINKWKYLDNLFKDQNRRQAALMFKCLRPENGFNVIMRTDWDEPLLQFNTDTNADEIEHFARKEHEDWYHWEVLHNPEKNGKEPNPCLNEWDMVPEYCREYTRETVRSWPEFLAMIDMKIIRVKKD